MNEHDADDTATGTPLGHRVYDLVRAIPVGRVMTYGGVAAEVGAPRHAREVGWTLGRCGTSSDVPCHRVVLSSGRLSPGFARGQPELQRAALEAEGIAFDGEGRLDLGRYLWWPPDRDTSASGDEANLPE